MSKTKKKSGSRAGRFPTRPLLLAGGGLALIAGGMHLLGLTQLNKELRIQQAVKLHRVSISGITLRIDLILSNPTPGRISVKTPDLTVTHNGVVLGTSDAVSGQDYTVPEYGAVTIEPIYLTLDFLTLAMNARAFLTQYRQQGKALLKIRALTRIDNLIPVEKITEFNLGSSPAENPA